jgi:hypothetical protein
MAACEVSKIGPFEEVRVTTPGLYLVFIALHGSIYNMGRLRAPHITQLVGIGCTLQCLGFARTGTHSLASPGFSTFRPAAFSFVRGRQRTYHRLYAYLTHHQDFSVGMERGSWCFHPFMPVGSGPWLNAWTVFCRRWRPGG